MEKSKAVISKILVLWTGILLIYTFELNSLVGFFVSFVLWRLTALGGNRKLDKKKLLIIALLVSVSGNYKPEEFVFNAAVGVTVFQVINFFTKSGQESQQNWLPIAYVSMAIYYTLRMTLVFKVPEILSTAHEVFMSAEKFLASNQTIELSIALSFMAVNMAIFSREVSKKSCR